VGRIKRGNYEFWTHKYDHAPRHIHVRKDGKEIAKWDLENNTLMKGKMTPKILKLIRELIAEKKYEN